jgi:hypothetical protein
MSFAITDWNLNPNRNWYVTIDDSGSGIQVDLYTTQANTEAETNRVASGTGAYGTGSQITLVMDDAGTPEISLFNSDLDYHLAVTGESGDTSKTYHVAPFVDMDEISDGIYKSTALIQARALYEINLHTHTTKTITLSLASQFLGINVGDVVRIQSDRRNIDVLTTVTETVITGEPDSLTAEIETKEYVDTTYNG